MGSPRRRRWRQIANVSAPSCTSRNGDETMLVLEKNNVSRKAMLGGTVAAGAALLVPSEHVAAAGSPPGATIAAKETLRPNAIRGRLLAGAARRQRGKDSADRRELRRGPDAAGGRLRASPRRAVHRPWGRRRDPLLALPAPIVGAAGEGPAAGGQCDMGQAHDQGHPAREVHPREAQRGLPPEGFL